MTIPAASFHAGPLLQDKSALVVGASKGIGEAIARALFASGAKVMLSSRNTGLLETLAAELDATGERVRIIQTDVTDSASVENAVAATVAAFGRLDIAINNAGVQLKRTPFVDLTDEQYDWLMNVNLRGVFVAMKHELRAMLVSGGGSIVNIASVGGLTGLPNIAPYVASKHGVVGLTKTAALEYATRGIRVNALAPGTTMTDLFKIGPASTPENLAAMTATVPMQRIASPEEMAGSVIWLCSDAASYVTGITLPVDGGYIVP